MSQNIPTIFLNAGSMSQNIIPTIFHTHTVQFRLFSLPYLFWGVGEGDCGHESNTIKHGQKEEQEG